MPETRGKSLEAIQEGFKSPNAQSVRLGRRFLDGRFANRRRVGSDDGVQDSGHELALHAHRAAVIAS